MAFVGATKLVRHLLDASVPVAIATGSAQSSYQAKVSSKMDLFGDISHAVCSDDPEVTEGKPSPHVYLIAAARFKQPPEDATKVSI